MGEGGGRRGVAGSHPMSTAVPGAQINFGKSNSTFSLCWRILLSTCPGLMGLNSKGVAWPSVGRQQRTTYGGISGNAVKPMALKAVSAIAKVRNQQEISGKKSMGFLTISPYTDWLFRNSAGFIILLRFSGCLQWFLSPKGSVLVRGLSSLCWCSMQFSLGSVLSTSFCSLSGRHLFLTFLSSHAQVSFLWRFCSSGLLVYLSVSVCLSVCLSNSCPNAGKCLHWSAQGSYRQKSLIGMSSVFPAVYELCVTGLSG